jgi:hypothetical protein
VELVKQMNYGFSRIKKIHLNEGNKLVIILRNREMDRYARDFLRRHPDANFSIYSVPFWGQILHAGLEICPAVYHLK